jgi:hypothetical protein
MKRFTTVGLLPLAIASAASAIAIAGAAPAQAVSFVSTFQPAGDITVPGNLGFQTEVGQVNPTTGNYTRYGIYSPQLTDIAVNNSGTIYGSTYDELFILNADNSQTRVGRLTSTIPFGFNGLAFDNNNNLYALGGNNPRRAIGQTPGFYSINTSTGDATLIGNLGGINSGISPVGLAPTAYGFAGTISTGDTSDIVYNPSGDNFFAVTGNDNAQLFTISKTGVTNKIGSGTGFGYVAGLTYEGGVLRGYDVSRRQIVIDTTTGLGSSPLTLTGISTIPNGNLPLLGGAASTPTAVPEPFTIVGTMIGGAAALKMRKRLKATNKL